MMSRNGISMLPNREPSGALALSSAKSSRVWNIQVLMRGFWETIILKCCVPTGKTDRPVGGEALLADRLPDLRQEPAVIGHVVQRQQRRAEHLLRQEEVVQVRPAEVAARVAQATGLQGSRISLVPGVAQAEQAVGGEG